MYGGLIINFWGPIFHFFNKRGWVDVKGVIPDTIFLKLKHVNMVILGKVLYFPLNEKKVVNNLP